MAHLTFTHILLLALVQGVTEFLPVSSSAHLQLIHALTPLPDQGVLMDVAVHFGTLAAVVFYLRKEMRQCVTGARDIFYSRASAQSQLVRFVFVASLPVIIAGGALMASGWVTLLRDPQILAWAMILFAAPLYLADAFTPTDHTIASRGWRGAVIIGLAQIAALIPGASRAGVTITAARALGIGRVEAARFSMLLSVPVITIFTLGGVVELAAHPSSSPALENAALAALLAALAALASMHLLLRFVAHFSFLPFVLYRLALGGGLLLML